MNKLECCEPSQNWTEKEGNGSPFSRDSDWPDLHPIHLTMLPRMPLDIQPARDQARTRSRVRICLRHCQGATEEARRTREVTAALADGNQPGI